MIGPTILAPSGVMPTICDVADGALVCYRAGDDLSLEHVGRDGTITALAAFAVVAPGGGDSTFPRLLSWQGRQWLGYRSGFSNVAALREVTGGFLGPELRFSAVVGNSPVAFSEDGWFGWQRADGTGVDGIHLDALGEAPVRLSTRYAPTGLAYLAAGGAPVFVDDNRGSVPGMYDPSRTGAAIVGKGLDGGLAVTLDGQAAVLLPGQFTNDPAAADLGGGLYAAVYWMPQGNALGPVECVLFTAADVQSAPIVIPPINRPCLFGWFTYGASGEEPGNCVLTVDAKMHVLDRASGEVLATFVEGSPDGDVAAVERAIAAAHAAEPSLPIIAYWTAAAQADRIPLGAEVLGVELYPRAGESLEAAEQRVRTSVGVCPAAILVVQAFTSNTSLTTDLAGVLAIAARIAAECRNVVGLLLFSAGSANTHSGYAQHPEMHAAYAAVFGSVLGLAVLPRPHAAPPMPVPQPVPVPKPAPQPTPVPQPPASPFGDVRPYEVAPMDPQIVGLIGPGGKFASVNKVTKQLTFDKTAVGIDEQFELSKPDDRFQIKNIGTGLIVGIDVTQYGSNDLRKLFTLHDPATQPRGNYESFFVGKTPNGLILAFIEYISQGAIVGAFASPALTVVPQ